MFFVNGAHLIEGKNGMFLSMPSYKKGDGSYQDICHATTKEFHDLLQETAVKAYESDQHFYIENGKTNPTIKADMHKYVNEDRNIYGIGSIHFNNEFVLNNVQVREVLKGERAGEKFIAMPTGSPYERDGNTIYPAILRGSDQDKTFLISNIALKSYKNLEIDDLVNRIEEASLRDVAGDVPFPDIEGYTEPEPEMGQ